MLFITLILLTLCVSAVSATDNSNDTSEIVASEDTRNIDTKVLAISSEISTVTNSVKSDVRPARIDVDIEDVNVVYKKKSYFKVKVEDEDADRPVKNLKLNVKLVKNSKSKIYTIKTNYKGIAKFNTKNLKVGSYKVRVTSTDAKYPVDHYAKIFVGKKKTVSVKANSKKKLKNKDTIKVYTKYDDDDKELKVGFKGKAKHTKILKAAFYFKIKSSGKVIKRISYSDFDDGVLELPECEFNLRLIPIKVKIAYVTDK